MLFIKGRTANEVWRKAASKIIADPSLKPLNSRNGAIMEYLHVGMELKNPLRRWVSNRYPPMNPAFALAELIWIINGSDNAGIINHWNPVLPKYAGTDAAYYGAYGFRLQKQFGFDQLERACSALKNNPETRQVVLQIWSPEKDFPKNNGQPRANDIPCNVCSMLKVRRGKLEWTQIMRSNDLILGLPHNLVQFTYLQEIMAGWLGLKLGSYNHFSDSLHCYTFDLDKLRKTKSEPLPTNSDSIAEDYSTSKENLQKIFKAMVKLSEPHLVKAEASPLMDLNLSSRSFSNLYRIIYADSMRRRGWLDLAEETLKLVTNPTLKLLWNNWCWRFEGANRY